MNEKLIQALEVILRNKQAAGQPADLSVEFGQPQMLNTQTYPMGQAPGDLQMQFGPAQLLPNANMDVQFGQPRMIPMPQQPQVMYGNPIMLDNFKI